MSLFKAREWWSTTVGDNEEFDSGCLCVADIDNKGFDRVIVGSYHGCLRIYQPSSANVKAEDVVCELLLSSPILQIETGRFVSGTDAVHIAVLHPRKISICGLSTVAGLTDHGVQHQLRCNYEHKLQRTAFNFCYGSFGGVKGRDFICVQSMDGTLSIFEQETFAFSRFLPNALLPGPIKYLRRTDSFVTVSSSCQLESYKFHVLATATDDKTKEESQIVKSGKRVAADWTFILNETALDLVVTNFQNTPLTIFVLGERNLYAVGEAGQLMFMKKFDYNPCCFLPYSDGKNDKTNTIIGTHSKTLLFYENISLKWAAQLTTVPVGVRVGNFQDQKGMLVTLDDEGHLQCSYLGTDPSLFTPPASEVRDLDYARVDAEMKRLQSTIKEHQSKSALPIPSGSSEEELKISVSVPSNLDKPSRAFDTDVDDEMQIPSVTATISMQAKSLLHNIKLSVSVARPLVASDVLTTVQSIEPGNPSDVNITFYMKYKMLPSSLRAEVSATYYNSSGAPRIVHASAVLPLTLVIRPCLPVKNATYKLTIDTNKPPVSLNELFSHLMGDGSDGSANAVGFKVYGMEPVVSLLASKTSQRYRVQCNNFAHMWHLLNELAARLAGHFKMGRSSDFRLSYDSPLPLQDYFEAIDRHFECRGENENLGKVLEDRAAQFRAVQKRLLVMFKDKTPVPLKNLDTLLDSTYKQIIGLADTIEEKKAKLDTLSVELSCATRVMNLLIQLANDMNREEFGVLESVLIPGVGDSTSQGWEEMVDAAITHLLRTNLSKTSKDVMMNPTPLTPLKDVDKLKKHISLMVDRLSKGAKLCADGLEGSDSNLKTRPTKNATSKEEFADEDDDVPTAKKSNKNNVAPRNSGAKSAPTLDDVGLSNHLDGYSRGGKLPTMDYTAVAVDNGTDDNTYAKPSSSYIKKKKAAPEILDAGDSSDAKDLDDTPLHLGSEELVYGL